MSTSEIVLSIAVVALTLFVIYLSAKVEGLSCSEKFFTEQYLDLQRKIALLGEHCGVEYRTKWSKKDNGKT